MGRLLCEFLKRVDAEGIRLHGVCVFQHNEEADTHAYSPDMPRNIYSVSKSFLSTAIGILLEDGALKLTDRPVDFFPENLPAKIHPWYEKLELRHLLTMTSGHPRALLHERERGTLQEADWIRFVFSQRLVSMPGESFMYSNGSSYLAGCMAEKAAGMKLKDFLYEKAFAPMHIPYPEWEECPMGHTFAASRLKLKLADMIKLGVLYLHRGNYQGVQIVSGDWVDTATSFQAASRQISAFGTGEDENFGYGYQFWLCRYPGIYRAFGRLGQFVIVVPEKDAVIATSAQEKNEQAILDAVWDTILPAL